MPSQPDPLTFFRLKPIRVARVSEISEITSTAPVPPEERINFHIGNPLQDVRLSSTFLRIALGIDVHQESLSDTNPDAILEYLGWENADRAKLDFITRTIQKPQCPGNRLWQLAGAPAGTPALRHRIGIRAA